MKKKLLSISALLMLFLLFQSFKYSEKKSGYYIPKDYHNNLMYRSTGPAANGLGDRTGSPIAGGGTCTACHGGGSYSPSITLNITDNLGNPITNYVAGVEYNLSFTITNSSGTPAGYGMQATALFANNTAAGTFSTPSSNAQIIPVSGRSYFEHNMRSTTSTFTSKWTAPSAGNGAVTFYFVGNAVNGTGGTSGDTPTAATTRTLNETLSTSDFTFQNNIKLEQNPIKDALKISLTERYQNIDLEIFDISGKSIFNKKYTDVSLINEDVNLSTGVYFVKLKNEDNSKATLKLVKE
ncbi:choice-of-anchor V domain-containing protein [Flavobacterium cheniae]|uniref:Putative secreted protein (Por secretion system target) n=1 Tax=Flavobacterium cheniae TaxID=295428 RepID=A0A562KCR2_9FLAO|nr:choice-of-anchor V domain-containing protein [Flavobacterium cheniae]TDR25325.1 putative secreted protein (Por secretion system target) [Flavobacterium cheniae]TWH93114.1 putative secreted protein (Por secretion system target) [Flavobacterium cheniae]